MKKFFTAFGYAICVIGLAAIPVLASNITLKGSDTMVILGQRWAETYMRAHPNVSIQITGGGSGTGISALINGTTDICASSRPMKDAEKEKLRERFSTTGVEVPVAKDGLAVYVNAANPIAEITIDQLRQVYTGKISNWQQLGGSAGPILLYSRENNSGTYVFFKEHVLQGADFSPRAQTMPGTAALVNAVSKDVRGIGYGGAAYAKGIKILRIKKDATSAGTLPDAASVASGTYPLARPLYFYLRNRATGDLKAFVDWTLSAEGQAIVSKVGYFPIH